MTGGDDEIWLDEEAGPLVRPYKVSSGRTRATVELSLLSLVVATGNSAPAMEPEHAAALGLCGRPISVAEVAAHLRLPVAIAKVILSDLVDYQAIATRAPGTVADRTDRLLLERLLDGLQRF